MKRRALPVWMAAAFFMLISSGLSYGQGHTDSLYKATLAEAMQKLSQENYPAALFNLKKCIELSPSDPVPYYQLSVAYGSIDEGAQAVYYARKAFSLSPDNLWYQQHLAALGLKYGNAEAVQQVMEYRYSQDDKWLDELFESYMYARSWDKALSLLDGYEKKHGRSERTLSMRKDIYLAAKDVKNALAQLKTLQKIAPAEAKYVVQSALLMEMTGQKEAWKPLEDFRKRYPDNGLAAYTLISHYIKAEENDKIFEAMRAVVADTSFADASAKMEVIGYCISLADKDEKYLPAVENAIDALLSSTEDPRAYAFAGDFYYRKGDQKRTMDLLREAVRRGFDDQRAVLQLLYMEAQDKDFPALYRDARMVLDSIGESAEIYYLYGYAAHSLGENQAGASALERAKQLAKGESLQLYVEICSLLGSVYNEMEAPDKAFENLDLALLIDPGNAGILNNYGYFLALREKDLDRARAMLEKALSIEPDAPAFLDSYAWILYLQKDYKAAQEQIERSLSLDEDPSSEVLEHYHRILLAVGDKEKAGQAQKRQQDKKEQEIVSKKQEKSRLSSEPSDEK